MGYILTARINPDCLTALNDLRKKYFPADRNFLRAHVTLFHQAPKEMVERMKPPPFPLEIDFGKGYFLGKGFAVEARCEPLSSWKKTLLSGPWEFTAQDRSNSRLHVTIQNKVSPQQAKEDFQKFLGEWNPMKGTVIGIDVWRYLNGPWEIVGRLEPQGLSTII